MCSQAGAPAIPTEATPGRTFPLHSGNCKHLQPLMSLFQDRGMAAGQDRGHEAGIPSGQGVPAAEAPRTSRSGLLGMQWPPRCWGGLVWASLCALSLSTRFCTCLWWGCWSDTSSVFVPTFPFTQYPSWPSSPQGRALWMLLCGPQAASALLLGGEVDSGSALDGECSKPSPPELSSKLLSV